ncbi:MAG: GIY-YIG nuclease family protein [Methanomassiliicoccales archaeon]|nr:GIY-YIG nuclease family protein [Methanomassiliicoccales archaeon]
MDRPGSYLLFISIDEPRELSIGRLGRCELHPGVYVYCGSALNGVKARVGRHFRKEKKEHWHIDRLLAAGDLMFALMLYSSERCECEMAKGLLQSGRFDRVIGGFGSSDCRCGGHLFYCDDLDVGAMRKVHELLKVLAGP